MIFTVNENGIIYYNIFGLTIILKSSLGFRDNPEKKSYLNQDRIFIGFNRVLIDILFLPMEPFLYSNNDLNEETYAGGINLPSIGFWVYTNKNWIDSYKNLYKVGEYL